MKAYCATCNRLFGGESEATPPKWLRLRQEARQESLPNTLWIREGVRILGV